MNYWACCREFEEGWHDSFVPDVDDSAGAADSSSEDAINEANHKLSCEVKKLEETTGVVPKPSSYRVAEKKAEQIVLEELPLQPVKRWWMVEMTVNYGLVKDLTEEELQARNISSESYDPIPCFAMFSWPLWQVSSWCALGKCKRLAKSLTSFQQKH